MNNLAVVAILIIIIVIIFYYYYYYQKDKFTPDIPGSYTQDPAARRELNALDVIQGSI